MQVLTRVRCVDLVPATDDEGHAAAGLVPRRLDNDGIADVSLLLTVDVERPMDGVGTALRVAGRGIVALGRLSREDDIGALVVLLIGGSDARAREAGGSRTDEERSGEDENDGGPNPL